MRWLNLGKLRNRGKIWHGQPCGDCGQEEGINGLNGNGKNEVLIKKKMYLKNKDYIRRITEWINIMDNVFREYKIKSRKNLNHKEMNKDKIFWKKQFTGKKITYLRRTLNSTNWHARMITT